MTDLKESYSGGQTMTEDILNFISGTLPLEPHKLFSFLMKTFANTKKLNTLDENCQILLTKIEEEIYKVILPSAEVLLGLVAKLQSFVEYSDILSRSQGILEQLS